MKRIEKFVSIHPYFKIHPGKEHAFRALVPAFNRQTASEEKALFYEFTINGDEAFCREGYVDAESALAHVANVKALLAEAAKVSDIARFEVHGPEAELAKLKGPLGGLPVSWFTLEN